MIDEIFTSQSEFKMIGYLRGDDAQRFIDVLDEVRHSVRFLLRSDLMVSFLFVSSAKISSPSRPWIVPTFRCVSERSSLTLCARYAVVRLCFLNR